MRLPLLVLVLFGTLASEAQYNFPFPTQNSVWTQWVDHWSTEGWPIYLGRDYESYYMTESDTMIGGSSYSQVFDHTGVYVAAVKDTDGKVVVVPDGMGSEYLLYDFTIPDGVDTTLEVWMLWYQQTMSVQMHGAGPIGNDGRIVVQGEGFNWVEGIGCTAGLFMEPWINVSGYWLGLDCMSTEDMTYYPVTAMGTCEITTAISDRQPLEMVVYPDLTNGPMWVELGSIGHAVPYTIHAMDGRVVQQGLIPGAGIWIDTSSLADGLYAIAIQDAGRLFRSVFMKSGQ